jgi:tetratricopeptide (TPR) repeat protein
LKILLHISIFFCCLIHLQAQDNYDLFLARQFAEQQEWTKAYEYYNKILTDEGSFLEFYDEYKAVLLQLKDYKNAEKLIKKVYFLTDKDPKYWIELGDLYAIQGDSKTQEKYYQKAMDELRPNPYQIATLALSHIDKGNYEEAIAVYQKGKALLKSPSAFALESSYVYGKLGKFDEMMNGYLDEAYYHPENLEAVKDGMQRVFDNDKEFDALEEKLLEKVGNNKTDFVYQDLLVWLYMQRNDFEAALWQAKSLDMLRQEDGTNIIKLARVAYSQKDYNAAIKAYKYVISKGHKNEYYVQANLELINANRDKLIDQPNYSKEQLLAIKQDYVAFLNQYYNAYTSTSAAIDYADFQAMYLHEPDSAIITLENYMNKPNVSKEMAAKAKLALGDYYLLDEQPWESLLLYTQVEKDFKNSVIGEEAKLRNARLSFYKGDFEWSQTQLRVIKANTPELISNDAIDLSVFIFDNLNQDTIGEALNAYAQADLLHYQNKDDEAIVAFTQILKKYPLNSLVDDIYFQLYKIFRSQQKFKEAAAELEHIREAYSQEILGDNATFYLAELNEKYLDDKSKAMSLYEIVFTDYTDSTYGIEAKKRYRILRGDNIPQE